MLNSVFMVESIDINAGLTLISVNNRCTKVYYRMF